MNKLNKLFLLSIILTLISCGKTTKLQEKEDAYGTGGEDLSVFHRILEQDKGLSLRFPGYIIGIEKSRRENISTNGGCIPYLQWFKEDDTIPLNKNVKNNERAAEIRSMLDDCKRAFVSHIIQYSIAEIETVNNQKTSIKALCNTLGTQDTNKRNNNSCLDVEKLNSLDYIKGRILHNAYTKDFNSKDAFVTGSLALETLKETISHDLESEKNAGSPYTHILFYSMGWNTDQQEALKNYNSLVTQLIENKPADTIFKPLFIGITWPSEWSWSYFEGLGKLLSYPVKADDADEVGLLWGNKFLRETLIPLKKSNNIPLIIVGHSFGARLTTMSIFASQFFQPHYYKTIAPHNKDDIDLVFGLQGAFSANRFIVDGGSEGFPYEKFNEYANKFIFTWSDYDTANPITSYIGLGRHVGGVAGKNTAENDNQSKGDGKKIFEFFTIKAGIKPDNNYDEVYEGIKEEALWNASFSNSQKISIIDASAIIKNDLYGNAGNAHSDIYTPAVARFIWDALEHIQKNKQ